MNVDDILFEPIGKSKTNNIADQITDDILDSFTNGGTIEFFADPSFPFSAYEKIADGIQKNPILNTYTKQYVTYDHTRTNRPVGALSIVDVFRMMQNGNDTFYFTSKPSQGIMIQQIRLVNWFCIENRIPLVYIDGHGYRELWILGLMLDFEGHFGFYTFEKEDDAKRYFGMP